MARNTIGKLSVLLTANTTPFGRGMRRAEKTLRTVGKAAGVASAALAGVGVAAAAGLAALTKQQLAATDSLAKNADRLGLSTEALAAYHHALELGGASIETGETALQRMNRRLAEAAQGGGVAAKAIDALGLNAQELANMNPLEAFGLIGERLAQVENTAERTRLQFAFFDTEGGKLFATLRGGRSSLKDAADEVERLGLVVSRVDAAKVEAANDAWTRTQRVLTGVGRQLAVRVAPVLEEAANLASHAGMSALAEMEAIESGAGRLASVVGGYISELLGGIDTIIEGVRLLKRETRPETMASRAHGLISPIVEFLHGTYDNASESERNSIAARFLRNTNFALQMAAPGLDDVGGIQSSNLRGSFDRIANQFRNGHYTRNAPPSPPANEQNQDETNTKIDRLISVVRDTHDTIRDKLNDLSEGSANAHLLQVLDRLAITMPEAARSGGSGGAGFGNGVFSGIPDMQGSLA